MRRNNYEIPTVLILPIALSKHGQIPILHLKSGYSFPCHRRGTQQQKSQSRYFQPPSCFVTPPAGDGADHTIRAQHGHRPQRRQLGRSAVPRFGRLAPLRQCRRPIYLWWLRYAHGPRRLPISTPIRLIKSSSPKARKLLPKAWDCVKRLGAIYPQRP